MPNESVEQVNGGPAWRPRQVYAMAAVCLVIGLAIGYLFRGSQSPAAMQSVASARSSAAPGAVHGQMPSLDQMKHMADMKAAPLLEKLKSDPTNVDLLKQVGNIYQATHQFKEAANYYDEALKTDPKNIPIRTQLASTLYYNGDVDGAIGQLQQSLQYDPKDANSLFNLGMIKWQGKQDSKGALVAWQQLLKSNPQLSPDRKATVQKMMAEVQTKSTS